MAREKLTPERIRRFTCPAESRQSFLWDTDVPRLAVRATGTGAKAFVFESKLNRQTIRVTIGDPAAWTVADARAEARRLQTLVDQGVDPRQEKAERIAAVEAKREEARRAEVPALKAWGAYVAARTPRWSERTRGEHAAVVDEGGKPWTRGRRKGSADVTQPGILRALLMLPLVRLDRDCVRAWLEKEAATRPTAARNGFAYLRGFLNWCADQPAYREQVNNDTCAARLARETLPKKAARSDCLEREQLPAWFAAVGKLPPVQAAYLQTVLLTGPRRNELTRLRWEDVDFRWDSMTIHDKAESWGGVEGTRTIPLTPYVKALLLGLRAINDTPPPPHRILHGKRIENDLEAWSPSEFVFASGRAASGHIEEPSSAHDRAMADAGIEGLTIHGLRRSFATLSEWCEAPEGVVAQIQGHKPSATREKHYKKRPLDLLRMWHTKIEGWILAEAGVAQPESRLETRVRQAL